MNSKKFISFAIFVLFTIEAFCNPFTKSQDSPTPVLQEKPNASVSNAMYRLSNSLSDAIYEWKENGSLTVLFSILVLAFLYGFIHALAPGHRKIVVFSYFLSRKASWLAPIALGLTLALVHALSSLVLMLIFKGVSGALSVATNNASIYMEGITYLVLILISLYGIVEAIIHLVKKDELVSERNLKLTAVILSSLYPCPAALLILVFAVNTGVFLLGVISIFILSLGMSLPIILSGYLAWGGRKYLFTKIQKNEKLFRLCSSVIQLFAFGILLYISLKIAMPFIVDLGKSIFNINN